MARHGPYRRGRDGRLVVTLDAAERAVFANLAAQLRAMLEHPDRDDPAVARLFPRAYSDPTEEEAEAEWQALAGSELLRGRLDALDALLEATADEHSASLELDAEQEAAWLGVLNDVRLVLGARLGVSDGTEHGAAAPGATTPSPTESRDPDEGLALLYDWLTWLQAEHVDLLLGELPG